MRTLFISSSIGLGHAGRDLAIANELRRLRPDVEIDWLAGDPATRLLDQAGERMLPESSVFRETGVAEANAGDFSLNLVAYVTHAARQWARVARTILRLIDEHEYEFVVGDETYELTIAFALRPALKTVPFAIIYDFFGVDAMSGNPFERAAVYALNHLWGGGRRGKAPPFDLVLFVGEPEDVPDRPLGARLSNRRTYATRHFAFIGYIVDFDATELRRNRSGGRAALGYDERPLIICSVRGTAVGADLLRLCAAAYPHLLTHVPDAHMLLVCGPRIDPATIPAPSGVEVRGFVPRLYEHFAACDVAIVQAEERPRSSSPRSAVPSCTSRSTVTSSRTSPLFRDSGATVPVSAAITTRPRPRRSPTRSRASSISSRHGRLFPPTARGALLSSSRLNCHPPATTLASADTRREGARRRVGRKVARGYPQPLDR